MTAKLVDPVDRCGVLYKPVNPTTMLVHVQCIPAQPLQLLRHLCVAMMVMTIKFQVLEHVRFPDVAWIFWVLALALALA